MGVTADFFTLCREKMRHVGSPVGGMSQSDKGGAVSGEEAKPPMRFRKENCYGKT